jgi:sugar lactone lactonase YvrE
MVSPYAGPKAKAAVADPSDHPVPLRPLFRLVLLAAALAALGGCRRGFDSASHVDLMWGRRGVSDGRLQKPRAMAVDRQDRLYIIDMTARIQVFDADGKFLRKWQTPAHANGRPTGVGIDRSGRVLVPDTHYFRLLIYTPDGDLVQTIGGTNGNGPGEFGFLTDAVEDSRGNYYVSEYGEYDRIQKFTHDGQYVLEWGGHGSAPGEFIRPQSMAIDEQDRIWVADACNHRIQVFDTEGKLLFLWGRQGSAPGELYYPYGIAFDTEGALVVCEYGNHRVQRFTPDGTSLGCWGAQGRKKGQLFNPWALAADGEGRIHVLDTNNHRVQRIEM